MTAKRDLINQAFGELGYESYAFDLEPEQMQAALTKLEGMMATWSARGINLGYFPSTATLQADSNTPQAADLAIALNLGLLLAPGIGKTPSPRHASSAKQAYRDVIRLAAAPPVVKLNPHATPAGQGNNRWHDSPFLDEPADAERADITDIDLG